DLVQVPTCGKNLRSPESFNPTAARDPFAWLFLIHALFDFGQKCFEAGQAFEVERHLAKTDPGEMVMRVSHSGQHRPAVQIYDATVFSDVFLRVAIRADENNAIAFDGNGFRG